MPRSFCQLVAAMLAVIGAAMLVGCGTTRSTDTGRTATEQLLISDAIDRAVQSVNLKPLAGQTVFLDDSRLGEVVDRNYLISTIRQHLLANGCKLCDKKDQADFVVEARAGAVGTDRNDLLFGVPSMNVPQILPMQPTPAAIPEIPIAKRKDQRGIAKIAVFAYHRETGMPVWQSGLVRQESSSNDVWILGAGPFQRGTIFDGTTFAGTTLSSEAEDPKAPRTPNRLPPVDLAHENTFTPLEQFAKTPAPAANVDQAVVPTNHQEPQAVVEAAATPINPPPSEPAPPATQPVASASPHPPANPAPAAAPPAPPTPAAAGSVYDRPDSASLPRPRFSSP